MTWVGEKMKKDGLLVGGPLVLKHRLVDVVSARSAHSDHAVFIDAEQRKQATRRTGCDCAACRAHIESPVSMVGRVATTSGLGDGGLERAGGDSEVRKEMRQMPMF